MGRATDRSGSALTLHQAGKPEDLAGRGPRRAQDDPALGLQEHVRLIKHPCARDSSGVHLLYYQRNPNNTLDVLAGNSRNGTGFSKSA